MWIYDNVVDCVCSGAAVAVPNLGQTPLVQQFYVSRALLLCVGLLRHPELQELRSELLQCMLGRTQSHLDSSVVRVRRMGMVVGKCLHSCRNISGLKLKFEGRSRNGMARPQNMIYTELWKITSSLPLVEPGVVFTTAACHGGGVYHCSLP
ncbi:telomere length regulation protein TEL2 homolog isoform X2 [Salmo trutta]|uniref:telomere length regulation protein TEL2 homolog isoform X2 n=1 Tax=Salmo trutta TaxID=8032 RepID=UPI001131087D|nr:telomere length regulation protein TEL2 homolog isoform X2 [Salmo trutta]